MNTINLKTLALSALMTSAMITGAFAMDEDLREGEGVFLESRYMSEYGYEDSGEKDNGYVEIISNDSAKDFTEETREIMRERNKKLQRNMKEFMRKLAKGPEEEAGKLLNSALENDEIFGGLKKTQAFADRAPTDNEMSALQSRFVSIQKDCRIKAIENLKNEMMDVYVNKEFVDLKGTYSTDSSEKNLFVYKPDDNNIVAGKPYHSDGLYYFDINDVVLGKNILKHGDKITASVMINHTLVGADVIASVAKTPSLHNVTVNNGGKRALPATPTTLKNASADVPK